MMARSHVAVGLAGWVVVAPLLHLPPFDPGALTLVVCGALAPDIDHPQSWVGRRSRPFSTLVAGALGHRGITHSALAVVALVAVLLHGGTSRATVSAFAVGYLSHLAADMLTPRGLRLAWPFRKAWGWPVCRTGSPAEVLIVMGLCMLAAFTVLQGLGNADPLHAARTWLARFLLAASKHAW